MSRQLISGENTGDGVTLRKQNRATDSKGVGSVITNYRKTVDVTQLSDRELDTLLNDKQKLFCCNYLKYANARQAALEAGYSEKSAGISAKQLLTNNKFVIEYISRKQREMQTATIADAQEILQYLTDVMRGEVKDQFGLDAPLAERTKAAQELARRQIDLPARMVEADNTARIEISLTRTRRDDIIDVD